ncbi:hypothetical protein ASF78_20395 [Cellulomonas sp. Leaf334]|nr:hypothetical protein ASF78_20395 [Cellulomonas sp. Leaf334]
MAHRTDWDEALVTGEYRTSTRGASLDDVGFIHASRREQLPAVARFVHAGDTEELCVLVLDSETIEAAGTDVRLEDGGDGQLFPHVFGPIRPEWVHDVLPAVIGADGELRF